MNKEKLPWWKQGSIYQVYVRSFKDSNKDGEGDLLGVVQKLPYIKSLGVKAVWLSPINKSPMVDNGYDVSDYLNINPMFGSMEDFDFLVQEAKKLDIKIIFDLVPSHCSTEHEWFKRALKGEKKYMDYFFFTPKPPYKRNAIFGGSVWEKASNGLYYMHTFAVQQADLNWANPNLRKEFYEIYNFWVKKGCEGFRIDAIEEACKPADVLTRKTNYKNNATQIADLIADIRAHTWKGNNDIYTMPESASSSFKEVQRYTDLKNKLFSAVLNFEHMGTEFGKLGKFKPKKFSLKRLKAVLLNNQEKVNRYGGWYALYLSNHDQSRNASRFAIGSKFSTTITAKPMGLAIHCFKGTPIVYQAEELGIDNNKGFKKLSDSYDVEVGRTYEQFVVDEKRITKQQFLKGLQVYGRDNARTPFPWNENGGFSEGKKTWMPYNPSFKKINVAKQEHDSDSTLNWYRKLINLRSDPETRDLIIEGKFRSLLKEHASIFAYYRILDRSKLLILTNWSDKTVNLSKKIKLMKKHRVLLNSHKSFELKKIQPWQAVLIKEGK